jgi:hypothetical protein
MFVFKLPLSIEKLSKSENWLEDNIEKSVVLYERYREISLTIIFFDKCDLK